MNVELTPDQRAFVQKAIESGRFRREEEAIQEALALWEERESSKKRGGCRRSSWRTSPRTASSTSTRTGGAPG